MFLQHFYWGEGTVDLNYWNVAPTQIFLMDQ